MIKRVFKQLLPRTVRRALQRTRPDLQIRSALKPLRRTGSLTHDEMLRFRGAWGNEGWSGDVRFLEETITAIKSFGGPVLECGSGATSILAGVLAVGPCDDSRERAAAIYSLLGTEQLNGPTSRHTYLRHVPERLLDYLINRVYELLPWAIVAELPSLRMEHDREQCVQTGNLRCSMASIVFHSHHYERRGSIRGLHRGRQPGLPGLPAMH